MRVEVISVTAMLVLLSCSAASERDLIEAKAQSGDPVAACEFAARNLHTCALQTQSWEQGALVQRLTCLDAALGDNGEAYLDRAMAKQTSPAYVMFLLQRASLDIATDHLAAGHASDVVASTEDPQQYCASLHRS